MKFMGLLVLCLVVAVAKVKAMTKEEKMELMKPLAMECKAQEKASDADLEGMKKHQLPTTPEGKCFAACMQTKMGMIVDGAFVPTAMIELAKKYGDDAKVKAATEIAEVCKGVSNADRCELAIEIIKCTHAEAAKRGIDFDC